MLALLVPLAACVPGRATAEDVLTRFVDAVQVEDLDALYCLCAGASAEAGQSAEAQRSEFDRWAASRYLEYEEIRDRGGAELSDDGIVLVKTFALGKGTFYSIESTSYADATLTVDTHVTFAYGQIDYSHLSPGTTFYLAAAPPGRIKAVKIPYEPDRISEEVLETVRVRFKLARVEATPACPEGWAVESVEPLAGSETTSRVTWIF
jgi:hypothetical protein